MNPNLSLAEIKPITLTPAQFLAAFHPGPYHLRTFADGGGGGGKNYQVSAAVLATDAFLAGLHLANQGDRQGVFFVVNPGGCRDDAIVEVAAHFVEADDLPLAQQYANLCAFPLPPSIIVKTRKSLHSYWLLEKPVEMGEYPITTANCGENSEDGGEGIQNRPGADGKSPIKDEPIRKNSDNCGELFQNLLAIDPDKPAAMVTDGCNVAAAARLAAFRPLQKALAAVFQGDPVISNPSRVMRLPGFFHNKQAPLLVTCLKFDPQQRYSQAELQAAIALMVAPAPPAASKPLANDQAAIDLEATDLETTKLAATNQPATAQARKPPAASPAAAAQAQPVGIPEFCAAADAISPQRMIASCAFLSHAHTTAASLSEPLWYAMITQLAGLAGGAAAIHALSCAYPGYSRAATDKKIAQFKATGAGPMTCETLRSWGYQCPRLATCPASAPWQLGKPPLPSWYLKKPNGYRLMPGILANQLAQHKRIFYAGEAYYQYLGGVYKMVDERHCQKIVRKYLRPDHVHMAQINDVLSQWTVEISRSTARLNGDKKTINLNNGRFDLTSQQLLPHDPASLSTIQLQPAYDQNASAPIFMAFLADCLDGDSQRLIQEIFGYLLIPETCAQKAFVFVGAGGAGKSTLLSVAQDVLLGTANVSNIPWQQLGDRFKTAELFGMLANIFADLPSKSIEDNGLFKSITGEDFITAERKNKDPFSFKATARLVFSCNSLPKNLGDRTEAFYRRLIIVPFLPPKPPDQRDLHLKAKLKAEAAGILNWALAGLARLQANHYCFTQSPASQAALDAYRIAGSSVRSFVDECCAIDSSSQAPATLLFHAYGHYCQESGLRSVSHKRFWMELNEAYPALEKVKERVTRRIMYAGIELLDLEAAA